MLLFSEKQAARKARGKTREIRQPASFKGKLVLVYSEACPGTSLTDHKKLRNARFKNNVQQEVEVATVNNGGQVVAAKAGDEQELVKRRQNFPCDKNNI